MVYTRVPGCVENDCQATTDVIRTGKGDSLPGVRERQDEIPCEVPPADQPVR